MTATQTDHTQPANDTNQNGGGCSEAHVQYGFFGVGAGLCRYAEAVPGMHTLVVLGVWVAGSCSKGSYPTLYECEAGLTHHQNPRNESLLREMGDTVLGPGKTTKTNLWNTRLFVIFGAKCAKYIVFASCQMKEKATCTCPWLCWASHKWRTVNSY